MDREKLCSTLLEGLLQLEISGDIVITHTIPSSLAERLSSELIRSWAGEICEQPPLEQHINDSLRASTNFICRNFGITEQEALAVAEQFYQERRKERTLTEFTELVWHQGPDDLGLGAYYSVFLKQGNYYSTDYLNFRIAFNSRKNTSA